MAGLIVGLALILAGSGLLWLCWRGSQHRLAPTSWVGIRLPSVRRTDQTWYVAHEAAASSFGLGGGIAVVCGIGVFVNGLDVIGVVVASVGLVAFIVGIIAATMVGLRAVRRLPEATDHPDFGG